MQLTTTHKQFKRTRRQIGYSEEEHEYLHFERKELFAVSVEEQSQLMLGKLNEAENEKSFVL